VAERDVARAAARRARHGDHARAAGGEMHPVLSYGGGHVPDVALAAGKRARTATMGGFSCDR
jgi:hypothetical protein